MTSPGVHVERGGPLAPAMLIAGSLALLTAGVVAGADPRVLALLTVATSLVASRYGALTRWHVLLGAVVAVILFVPIRRYQFGVDLPFDLEPYRIAVGILVALWLSALLIDPSVRLRGTAMDAPLAFFAFTVLGSVVVGIGHIEELGLASNVLKKILFLASFYLVFYFVASVVRDRHAIDAVIKTLVAGGTVIAAFAIFEARTEYNLFDHLQGVVPFLSFEGALDEEGIARGVRLRVYGSAQHPIALAGMLAMLLPLTLYLVRSTGRYLWWAAGGVIALAVVATVSRTGISMLIAAGVILLWLRPSEVKRLLPLIVPAAVVVYLALPGTIGAFLWAFFPSNGIVDDQQVGAGRLSMERLGPQFEVIAERPLLGQGYGTRITIGDPVNVSVLDTEYAGLTVEAENRKNARVLDNEWLGTAVETGVLGLAAWIWFFVRFVRRTGREATRDPTCRGLLLAALASAVTAFAVGMLTFDAFSFIQVTFVLFILAGLGMSVLGNTEAWAPERRPAERFGRPARQSP